MKVQWDTETHDAANIQHLNDIKLQIEQMQAMLQDFVMPLSYDGSEAIFRLLQNYLTRSLHDLVLTFDGGFPNVELIKCSILEQLYFNYKKAQTASMKIRGLLQQLLIIQLDISEEDIRAAVDNYNKAAKFLLGKLYIPMIIKDSLIEAAFWPAVGPETHIMLPLLEAKLVFESQGASRWHKRQLMADDGEYQQIIEQISTELTAIRHDKKLSLPQRKQKILHLLKQHKHRQTSLHLSNLSQLLQAAEQQVKDYKPLKWES